jgi:nucleotide-binding universal stress UspA family protein
MSTPGDSSFPIIDSILHPTDFSEGSLVAFHHALRIALTAKASLTLLHDATVRSGEGAGFPGVRETLGRWGLLPPDSPQSAAADLGIEVRKVVTESSSPVGGVLHYLEGHPADLIVLATHQHEGRIAWLRHSVAQPLARKSGQATLIIPEDSAGFISASNGEISLGSVLIPISMDPDPQMAIEAAARLVRKSECTAGSFTLLHVGEPDTLPEVECPEVSGWSWQTISRTGDVVHSILDAAHKRKADLIVMATSGRRGFLDALRGTHTEQVMQKGKVPLLTVPSGSRAEQTLARSLL